jgi:hypothetical protein
MRTLFLLLLVIVCVLVMAGCQAIQRQANNDTDESAATDPGPPVEAVEEAAASSGAPDDVDVNETTTAQRMVDEVAVSVDETGVIKVDGRTVDSDNAIDAVKQESPLRSDQPLRIVRVTIEAPYRASAHASKLSRRLRDAGYTDITVSWTTPEHAAAPAPDATDPIAIANRTGWVPMFYYASDLVSKELDHEKEQIEKLDTWMSTRPADEPGVIRAREKVHTVTRRVEILRRDLDHYTQSPTKVAALRRFSTDYVRDVGHLNYEIRIALRVVGSFENDLRELPTDAQNASQHSSLTQKLKVMREHIRILRFEATVAQRMGGRIASPGAPKRDDADIVADLRAAAGKAGAKNNFVSSLPDTIVNDNGQEQVNIQRLGAQRDLIWLGSTITILSHELEDLRKAQEEKDADEESSGSISS